MASAAEIRDAMLALQNAAPKDKAAAKSLVTTLCGQTALTMAGTERDRFVAQHHDEIEKAMRA